MQLAKISQLYLTEEEIKDRGLVPNNYRGGDHRFPPRNDSDSSRILVAAYCVFIDGDLRLHGHQVWYYRHKQQAQDTDYEVVPSGCCDLETALLYNPLSHKTIETKKYIDEVLKPSLQRKRQKQ
jgi:hypothetical protein